MQVLCYCIFYECPLNILMAYQSKNLTRNTTIYPVTGSFDNPAGFSACLSTAFPLIFLLLQNNKLYKLSGIVSGVIIGTAVVVFGSRAEIICLTISLFNICLHSFISQNRKIEMVTNQCLSLQKSDMKRSVFNKALDSFNEYMANQGCYLFDPPVQEFSSEEEGYVFLGNRNSSFGRYEIETGVFIPDGEDESTE